MGTLYVVSTPIGNLEDITLRALRVLREASLIAAEDTRHTRRLLQRYDIATPCISYHEHNKLMRLDDILTALITGDVALVSDAGTPALSDPGYELVRTCIAAGFAVVPVPGASAPLAALVASGLPTDRFLYLGFLPRRSSERRTALAAVAALAATLVCFEAPHRVVDTLEDMLAVFGDRQMTAARELTKLHESWQRGPISAVLAHFQDERPRGEFTLVIEGAKPRPTRGSVAAIDAASDETAPTPEALEQAMLERLAELRGAGERGSSAARTVASEFGVPKQMTYQLWLRLDADTAE
ncbi:MAG: 16S rRNA (cytidine(1402)-2'-O)-methyltransferase [Chloroflexaceae bacterium]|nr:16S rRNA (cytidine(1402)-2'-O)-methyltransferase [Chloroflexaceae bacterium]NJL33666.1 16S rRNA (cytidine(1402)-2'-O)-methyltransferase [Chloroflexaceae bacterium]